jgi:hypothetical protein
VREKEGPKGAKLKIDIVKKMLTEGLRPKTVLKIMRLSMGKLEEI